MSTPKQPAEGAKPTPHLTRAWAWLAIFPLTIPVAFFVLYTVLAFTGYSEARAAETPWWSYALAAAATLAVVSSPLALIIPASNKAKAAGERYARAPVVVALLLIASFLVVPVLSIGGLLLGG